MSCCWNRDDDGSGCCLFRSKTEDMADDASAPTSYSRAQKAEVAYPSKSIVGYKEFQKERPSVASVWNFGFWVNFRFCRRRRQHRYIKVVAPVQMPPMSEDAAIVTEWNIVRSSIDASEFAWLCELRSQIAAAGLDAHPACEKVCHSQRAATLLRFLRARGGDVGKSAALLRQALDWRRDFQLDQKLADWRSEWDAGTSARVKLIRKFDFVAKLGPDRTGLPVYLHRLSQADPGGLVREVSDETFLLHLLRSLEDSFEEAQELMLKTHRLHMNFIEVYDLGNYGLVPKWMQRGMAAIGPYTRFTFVFDTVYPERVRTSFVLRTPLGFSTIWRMVLPLVPEATRGKIRLRGFQSSTWIREMESLLPDSSIPLWLKSDNAENFALVKPWGGCIPEGAIKEFI